MAVELPGTQAAGIGVFSPAGVGKDCFSSRVRFPSCLTRYLIGGEKDKPQIIAKLAREDHDPDSHSPLTGKVNLVPQGLLI
jgi:hypothetical protein